MVYIEANRLYCSIAIEEKLFVLTLKNGKVHTILFPYKIQQKEASENNELKDEPTKAVITSLAFSPSLDFLAVADDIKQLHILNYQNDVWSILNSRIIPKRSTSLAFTMDNEYILVADKSGDVTRSKVHDIEGSCEVVAGHLSMLLHMILLDEDRYLATCDRDEKIRISHYPNCYNIHQFLLAHTDYVSQLLPLFHKSLLLSASGDGKVILWDYKEGCQLSSINTHQHLTFDSSILCALTTPNQSEAENPCKGCDIIKLTHLPPNNFVAVSFHRRKEVVLLKYCHRDGENYELSHMKTKVFESKVHSISSSDRFLMVVTSDDADSSAGGGKKKDGVDSGEGGAKGVKLFIYEVNAEGEFLPQDTPDLTIFNRILADIPVSPPRENKLHKVHIDNLTEYIERKRQRVQCKMSVCDRKKWKKI